MKPCYGRAATILLICFLITACDKGKKPYEEAKALFDKADYSAAKSKAQLSLNAQNSKYYFDAAALYRKTEMIEHYLRVVQEATQSSDLEKAIKAYEDILTLDSNCPEAIAELPKLKEKYERKSKLLQDGESFVKSGDWEKAIETYKTILTFVPNDLSASLSLDNIEEYLYPPCCREEINKYRARRESMSDIREIFSQKAAGENEFELKKDEERIKKERNEISRTTVFFDILSGVKVSGHDNDPYISEYDFKKQEYKVGFGVMRGSSGGERYGIASSPDVVQIANDKGNRMEFTLKMKENEAESFDKEHIKLFVVYKFIKGEKIKHWDPLQAQLRGGDGSQENTRIYIKPINVILLSGDSKCTIYEAEDKHVSATGRLTNNGTGDSKCIIYEDKHVSAVGRLTNTNHGTVMDSKTHFMWQQGEGGDLNWDTAIAYCNNLSLAGYNDWRLPNKEALESIIVRGEGLRINKTDYPNAHESYYWSSTTDAGNASVAWVVSFGSGDSGNDDKTDSDYVRCVRGGQ